MPVRHVNPNMIMSVLNGIEQAEKRPDLDTFEEMLATIEREQPAMQRPTGRLMPARRIAFAEGYIAAFRSACSSGAS